MSVPRRRALTAGLAASLAVIAGCGLARQATKPAAEYGYKVVKFYPHDRNAFTQGLVYDDGTFVEGTGLYGQSQLRRVDVATGKVLEKRDLPATVFGEGVALAGGRVLQLTWQAKKGFIYDAKSFEPQGQFAYDTEGWGLTFDGKNLILSDGSPNLFFLDPKNFKVVRKLPVASADGPVRNLNELEFIKGEVWANVWQTDRIARIDPATGKVNAWVDLTGLSLTTGSRDPDDVLNGIAYDSATGRLFVTGKRWPYVFQIELTGPK